jgi:hypothetical protein
MARMARSTSSRLPTGAVTASSATGPRSRPVAVSTCGGCTVSVTSRVPAATSTCSLTGANPDAVSM